MTVDGYPIAVALHAQDRPMGGLLMGEQNFHNKITQTPTSVGGTTKRRI